MQGKGSDREHFGIKQKMRDRQTDIPESNGLVGGKVIHVVRSTGQGRGDMVDDALLDRFDICFFTITVEQIYEQIATTSVRKQVIHKD